MSEGDDCTSEMEKCGEVFSMIFPSDNDGEGSCRARQRGAQSSNVVCIGGEVAYPACGESGSHYLMPTQYHQRQRKPAA